MCTLARQRKPGCEIKNMYYIHHMSIPLALTLILIITLDLALPPPYGSLCPKVNKCPKPSPSHNPKTHSVATLDLTLTLSLIFAPVVTLMFMSEII